MTDIAARKAQRNSRLRPPCPLDRIEGLRRLCRQQFGAVLPESYAGLLRRTDGVDWNGTVFYASAPSLIVGHVDRRIEGFVEANLAHRDVEECRTLLIFGESGLEMYAYSLDAHRFQVMDQVSLDVLESYHTFEQLFSAAYQKRL